jgi:hypothetical protein
MKKRVTKLTLWQHMFCFSKQPNKNSGSSSSVIVCAFSLPKKNCLRFWGAHYLVLSQNKRKYSHIQAAKTYIIPLFRNACHIVYYSYIFLVLRWGVENMSSWQSCHQKKTVCIWRICVDKYWRHQLRTVATVSQKQKQVEEFVELIQIQITAGADHFIAAVAGAVFGHGHFSY